jgi:hypothetical protein
MPVDLQFKFKLSKFLVLATKSIGHFHSNPRHKFFYNCNLQFGTISNLAYGCKTLLSSFNNLRVRAEAYTV